MTYLLGERLRELEAAAARLARGLRDRLREPEAERLRLRLALLLREPDRLKREKKNWIQCNT